MDWLISIASVGSGWDTHRFWFADSVILQDERPVSTTGLVSKTLKAKSKLQKLGLPFLTLTITLTNLFDFAIGPSK